MHESQKALSLGSDPMSDKAFRCLSVVGPPSRHVFLRRHEVCFQVVPRQRKPIVPGYEAV